MRRKRVKKKGAGSDGGVGIVTAMVQQMKVVVMLVMVIMMITVMMVMVITKITVMMVMVMVFIFKLQDDQH